MSKQLKMGVRNKKARVLLPAVFVGGGAPVLASGGRASPRAEAEATTYAYDAVGRLIREGGKSYAYGYLDKVMSVRENNNLLSSFDYAVSGQIASATRGDQKESFLWDGLALIHRDGVNYLNEPHAGGGAPVLAGSDKILFNDLLGSTVGTFDSNGKFASTSMTTYGDDGRATASPPSRDNDHFFTGKPHVAGLGHAFLLRNYRSDLGKWQTADPMGYPDGLNNFAYVNGRVTDCFDYLGAWLENVHLTDTIEWAINVGFTEEQAQRIGNANNGVDSGSTGPFPVTGDLSRHFNTPRGQQPDSRMTHFNNEMNNAVNLWDADNFDAALDALGRALHSLQDIYAHGQWYPNRIHPDWYDDPSDPRRTTQYERTHTATTRALNDFRRRVGLAE